MPTINADDGCPINVEVEGRESAPVLMLSNSLGTNLHMWDDQARELAKHFRLVRYDRRGHGKSGVPQGPLLDGAFRPRRDRGARRARRSRRSTGAGCRWAAWSASGSARTRPTASRSLSSPTPISTTPTRAPWNDRIKFVREKGLGELVGPNMERWFTKDFRDARAADDRAHDRNVPRHQSVTATSRAAKRSATWTSPLQIRASPRRLW